MRRKFALKAGSLGLAFALAAACPLTAAAEVYESIAGASGVASSDEPPLPETLKGDTEIEQLTDAYHEARAKADAAEAEVAALQARIDEIDGALPRQQELSDEGIKQRYIMQSNPVAVFEPLLSSQSLDDFLRQVDYLELVSRKNLQGFNVLQDMKQQAANAQDEQEAIRNEAAAALDEALAALSSEQDGRTWKQELAQADAIRQAGEAGGEADGEKDGAGEEGEKGAGEGAATGGETPDASDAPAAPAKAADRTEASDGGEAEDNEDPEGAEEDEDKVPVTQDTSAIPDGADWHSDRDDFIAEWTPRIDAYLAGSPLEGQGANFAASAWKYGVDPRWSPAISNSESSKGTYCIRPHNAWGWGAADSDPYGLASEWESWEEAIDAHVAGLSRGYGYTISIANAQKYCSSWRSWYNNTLGQMALI